MFFIYIHTGITLQVFFKKIIKFQIKLDHKALGSLANDTFIESFIPSKTLGPSNSTQSTSGYSGF